LGALLNERPCVTRQPGAIDGSFADLDEAAMLNGLKMNFKTGHLPLSEEIRCARGGNEEMPTIRAMGQPKQIDRILRFHRAMGAVGEGFRILREGGLFGGRTLPEFADA